MSNINNPTNTNKNHIPIPLPSISEMMVMIKAAKKNFKEDLEKMGFTMEDFKQASENIARITGASKKKPTSSTAKPPPLPLVKKSSGHVLGTKKDQASGLKKSPRAFPSPTNSKIPAFPSKPSVSTKEQGVDSFENIVSNYIASTGSHSLQSLISTVYTLGHWDLAAPVIVEYIAETEHHKDVLYTNGKIEGFIKGLQNGIPFYLNKQYDQLIVKLANICTMKEEAITQQNVSFSTSFQNAMALQTNVQTAIDILSELSSIPKQIKECLKTATVPGELPKESLPLARPIIRSITGIMEVELNYNNISIKVTNNGKPYNSVWVTNTQYTTQLNMIPELINFLKNTPLTQLTAYSGTNLADTFM